MNYYIAALLVACVGPSVVSVNVLGVALGFWAWGVIMFGLSYFDERVSDAIM